MVFNEVAYTSFEQVGQLLHVANDTTCDQTKFHYIVVSNVLSGTVHVMRLL